VRQAALHSVHTEKKERSLHLSASLAVVHLLAPLAALVGPREVGDGNEEERVAGVGDTSEGVVPLNNVSEMIMGSVSRIEHTKL
jgi:hypothetical protein